MKRLPSQSDSAKNCVVILMEKLNHLSFAAKNPIKWTLWGEIDYIGTSIKKNKTSILLEDGSGSIIFDLSVKYKKSLFESKINFIKEEDYIKNGFTICSRAQITLVKQRAIEMIAGIEDSLLNSGEMLEKLLSLNVKSDSELIDYIDKEFEQQKKYRLGKRNPTERSAVLAFDLNKNATLVMMHNTKLSEDENVKSYQKAKLGKGTYKKVKSALDLMMYGAGDNSGANLARASIVLEPASFKDCIYEIKILCEEFSDADYIVAPKYFSAPFVREKNGKKQVLIYAFYKPADCSLLGFFKDPNLFVSPNESAELLNFWAGKTNEIPETLKSIMVDIAMGLKQIHGKGFVHQDIKLENILLFKNGNVRAKISDFSLVSVNKDRAKLACSSIYVAAPEIFAIHKQDKYYGEGSKGMFYSREIFKQEDNQKKNIEVDGSPDQKADIWAIGVLFYLLLTRNIKFIVGTADFLKEHERISSLKEKYPFLEKSIEIIPQNRSNINQVLDLLQQSFYPSSSNNDSKKIKI